MFYGDQLVYLLVFLVCWKTMASKNFSYRENWVGSKVAGMKIAFLPILVQHVPTFWSQNGQNMEFLKQNSDFQSLRKTVVYYYQVCDLKTG